MIFKMFFLNFRVSDRDPQTSFIVLAGPRNHPRSEKREWDWGGGAETKYYSWNYGLLSPPPPSLFIYSAPLSCSLLQRNKSLV